MSEDVADTWAKKKRESQVDRVARVMCEACSEPGTWEARAKAVIAVMPEPRVQKERDAPKGPDDYCRLHATRKEFAALVEFIEARSDNGFIPGSDTPRALARVLREQGVVTS